MTRPPGGRSSSGSPPLVVAITRGYRLSLADAQDVGQMVWLKLFENIAKLREPQALPGWICTTTKREALRQLSGRARKFVGGQAARACAGSLVIPGRCRSSRSMRSARSAVVNFHLNGFAAWL